MDRTDKTHQSILNSFIYALPVEQTCWARSLSSISCCYHSSHSLPGLLWRSWQELARRWQGGGKEAPASLLPVRIILKQKESCCCCSLLLLGITWIMLSLRRETHAGKSLDIRDSQRNNLLTSCHIINHKLVTEWRRTYSIKKINRK